MIEADTFKVNGKFFEFLIDKEVVRTLKVDAVLQIRRMDDDEEGDDEEGDPAQSTDAILSELVSRDTGALDEILVSMPGTEVLDALRSSMPGTEELDALLTSIPEVNLDQILRDHNR